MVLLPIIQVTSVYAVYSRQASLNLSAPVNVCDCQRTDQKLIGLALLHFYLLYFILLLHIYYLTAALIPIKILI